MDELVLWLGEQLDEDERIARTTDQTQGQSNLHWSVKSVDEAFCKVVAAGYYDVGTGEFNPEDAAHIAEHDPARVLREIAAKRQLLQLHTPSDLGTWVGDDDDKQPACRTCGNLTVRFPCATLRLLALPYADRPTYREEWAP